MADAGTIVKKVRTDFVADGLTEMARDMRKAKREAQALAKAKRGLAHQFGQMKRLAKVGLMGGAGVVAGLVAIGKAAEDSELRIAGLLQKNSQLFDGSFKTFEAARTAAQGLRQEFREMAITSPVTSAAITDAFVNMTTELSRGGIDIAAQKALAKSVATADLSNAVKGTAARDVAQLLRGRAGRDISTPALVGQTAKEIAGLAKKGKVQEAAARIAEVLKPSPELEKAYAQSFTGATSSLKDALTQVGEVAGKPLMQELSKGAQELLKWLKQNRHQVTQMARSLGRGVVKALKTAGQIVRTIAQNWDTVVAVLKTAATVWLAQMVSRMGVLVTGSIAYARNMAAGSAAGGKGLIGRLANGAGALGVAYMGAQAIASYLNDRASNQIEGYAALKGQTRSFGSAEQALAALRAENTPAQAVEGDYAGKPGGIGGGGGGSSRVRKLHVDNMELNERGTARLMSPFVREMARSVRRNSPLSTQVGLGGLRISNGVR